MPIPPHYEPCQRDAPTFDLVVPLYNEEANIAQLVRDVADTELPTRGLCRMILVNNGSADRTGAIIAGLAEEFAWVSPLTLTENQMYGGGLYAGMRASTAQYIGMVPGDNQVHPRDVLAVWNRLQQVAAETGTPAVFAKGRRTTRFDGADIRFASWFYTHFTNAILNLGVADVNGHPKIFHRSLLDCLPDERMKTFTFDAQLLYTARQAGFPVAEEPVTFLARRHGVSSWATKRLRTYLLSMRQIVEIERIHSRAAATGRVKVLNSLL